MQAIDIKLICLPLLASTSISQVIQSVIASQKAISIHLLLAPVCLLIIIIKMMNAVMENAIGMNDIAIAQLGEGHLEDGIQTLSLALTNFQANCNLLATAASSCPNDFSRLSMLYDSKEYLYVTAEGDGSLLHPPPNQTGSSSSRSSRREDSKNKPCYRSVPVGTRYEPFFGTDNIFAFYPSAFQMATHKGKTQGSLQASAGSLYDHLLHEIGAPPPSSLHCPPPGATQLSLPKVFLILLYNLALAVHLKALAYLNSPFGKHVHPRPVLSAVAQQYSNVLKAAQESLSEEDVPEMLCLLLATCNNMGHASSSLMEFPTTRECLALTVHFMALSRDHQYPIPEADLQLFSASTCIYLEANGDLTIAPAA